MPVIRATEVDWLWRRSASSKSICAKYELHSHTRSKRPASSNISSTRTASVISSALTRTGARSWACNDSCRFPNWSAIDPPTVSSSLAEARLTIPARCGSTAAKLYGTPSGVDINMDQNLLMFSSTLCACKLSDKLNANPKGEILFFPGAGAAFVQDKLRWSEAWICVVLLCASRIALANGSFEMASKTFLLTPVSGISPMKF
mmetsp:Transcript_15873/g.38414  ORF Transcript_15873/g.38414 Transcript_15873/m.38414 type:complete len:203 (+) Transcript_15873:363-971(+)